MTATGMVVAYSPTASCAPGASNGLPDTTEPKVTRV